MYPPFGQTLFDGERVIVHAIEETTTDEVRTHIREIFVSTIPELQPIARCREVFAQLR